MENYSVAGGFLSVGILPIFGLALHYSPFSLFALSHYFLSTCLSVFIMLSLSCHSLGTDSFLEYPFLAST